MYFKDWVNRTVPWQLSNNRIKKEGFDFYRGTGNKHYVVNDKYHTYRGVISTKKCLTVTLYFWLTRALMIIAHAQLTRFSRTLHTITALFSLYVPGAFSFSSFGTTAAGWTTAWPRLPGAPFWRVYCKIENRILSIDTYNNAPNLGRVISYKDRNILYMTSLALDCIQWTTNAPNLGPVVSYKDRNIIHDYSPGPS